MVKTEEEILKRARLLKGVQRSNYGNGWRDALNWVLEEGPNAELGARVD